MKKLTQAIVFSLAFILPAVAEPGGISEAGWSKDGQYLVTTGTSRRVRVHDGKTGLVLNAVTAPGEATTIRSFSPDSGEEISNSIEALGVSGARAVTWTSDNLLRWWSLPELDNLASTETSYSVIGLNLAGEGQVAAYTDTSTRYLDSSMMLLRLRDSEIQSSYFSNLPAPDSSDSFGVPQLSPDGRWAIAYTGSFCQLWDLQSPDMTSVEIGEISLGALGTQHFFCITDEGVSMRSYTLPLEQSRLIPCSDLQGAYVDDAQTRLVIRTSDAIKIYNLEEPSSDPLVWSKKVEGMTLAPNGRQAIFWIDTTALEVWDLDSRTKLYRRERDGDLAEAAASEAI